MSATSTSASVIEATPDGRIIKITRVVIMPTGMDVSEAFKQIKDKFKVVGPPNMGTDTFLTWRNDDRLFWSLTAKESTYKERFPGMPLFDHVVGHRLIEITWEHDKLQRENTIRADEELESQMKQNSKTKLDF